MKKRSFYIYRRVEHIFSEVQAALFYSFIVKFQVCWRKHDATWDSWSNRSKSRLELTCGGEENTNNIYLIFFRVVFHPKKLINFWTGKYPWNTYMHLVEMIPMLLLKDIQTSFANSNGVWTQDQASRFFRVQALFLRRS